ncbi:hypothetical protein BJ508DRAFT_315369 [Ascobolus immersus RN42]|uniref:Uncharacterized protein n=1 Tax=Ascobolus immersus RN42 TaxID=1160509 RepID=A0A3N4HHB2_ASCIM|nr:hypothetical protein BJ508DRAFT_315369 [Ascobolus immersus RN42]
MEYCMLGNPSGKHWLPDDLYCEWFVREIKALIVPFLKANNPKHRDTLARQISLMQSSRLWWLEIIGAVNYGQRLAITSSEKQVKLIARKLLKDQVFLFRAVLGPEAKNLRHQSNWENYMGGGVDDFDVENNEDVDGYTRKLVEIMGSGLRSEDQDEPLDEFDTFMPFG